MKKVFIISLMALISCSVQEDRVEEPFLRSGAWLFTFDLAGEQMPVRAIYTANGTDQIMVIKNADEEIKIDKIWHEADSIFMELPVFGTTLSAKILNDSSLVGFWRNTTKSNDYIIPFAACAGCDINSGSASSVPYDFSGKWEVTFSPDEEGSCKALGVFKQTGAAITGTFLTETGDYRFLEGTVGENELILSGFDGAHAFLFKAKTDEGGGLSGKFWSGTHWTEPWAAKRNDSFELTHPDSITFVANKDIRLNLSKKDIDGKLVSLDDKNLRGKVIILQIMGTWCPNCADESKDLAVLYSKYKTKGLEILAISYERSDDFDVSSEQIRRFKNEVGAQYPFLFGGKVDKKNVQQDFPMLNAISSYPTAIYLDRKGNIRKIHTGYYGPSTGPYYIKYHEAMEMFVQKLLSESIDS